MTATDGTRLDPRLTALFDAGASWATEPTDRRGYGDALRDAVERAGTPGDRDRGRELAGDVVVERALRAEIGGLADRLGVDYEPGELFSLLGAQLVGQRCRDRLRALAAPQPGITREAVIEAVGWIVPVPAALRDKPGAAEAVADRLGLTEEAGQ